MVSHFLESSYMKINGLYSLGGFSISFFWPALDRNQSPKKQQKEKVNKKSTAANQVPT